jgi:hypothetical protein
MIARDCRSSGNGKSVHKWITKVLSIVFNHYDSLTVQVVRGDLFLRSYHDDHYHHRPIQSAHADENVNICKNVGLIKLKNRKTFIGILVCFKYTNSSRNQNACFEVIKKMYNVATRAAERRR